jgi:hypothetical protein
MNNEKWRETVLIFVLNQQWQCYEVPTRRLNSPKPKVPGTVVEQYQLRFHICVCASIPGNSRYMAIPF